MRISYLSSYVCSSDFPRRRLESCAWLGRIRAGRDRVARLARAAGREQRERRGEISEGPICRLSRCIGSSKAEEPSIQPCFPRAKVHQKRLISRLENRFPLFIEIL